MAAKVKPSQGRRDNHLSLVVHNRDGRKPKKTAQQRKAEAIEAVCLILTGTDAKSRGQAFWNHPSGRTYRIDLDWDLFGNYLMTRHWGSKGTRLGGQRTTVYGRRGEIDWDTLQYDLLKLCIVRDRHGYELDVERIPLPEEDEDFDALYGEDQLCPEDRASIAEMIGCSVEDLFGPTGTEKK
ncbi:hypothetical protein BAE30_04140 [Acidithiobacillus caldus]|uniref:WGR domain-containing protein n=1 Tax=Acidithiobacillus caldus TaxID=33059 RepID=A0A1E7YYX5_9PROT|nr:hypothetical protein BAE30_04140 [Acidithiobacillus caldus]